MKNRKNSRIAFAFAMGAAESSGIGVLERARVPKVLTSYWFMQSKRPSSLEGYEAKFKRLRNFAEEIFIDCGVFSMFRHLGIRSAAGGNIYKMSPSVVKRAKRQVMSNFKELVRYTEEYVEFLNRFDKYIDWAFDMDVDVFSSPKHADYLLRIMEKGMKHPEKIVRTWHFTRPFEDWKKWCDSGKYAYLSVEGTGTHNSDPNFYRRFVDYAHARKVKVHCLGATGLKFLSQVNVDTADSSTWAVGARYGAFYTPYGLVHVSRIGSKSSSNSGHWLAISAEKRKRIREWLASRGVESNIRKLSEMRNRYGELHRNLASVLCMLEVFDKPAAPDSIRRRSLLDEI